MISSPQNVLRIPFDVFNVMDVYHQAAAEVLAERGEAIIEKAPTEVKG